MAGMKRYAIYYAPEPGAFADFCAAWLGWDAAAGRAVAHPDVAGLPRPVAGLTAAPRKYGFHGTIKAPFHLAVGTGADDLRRALAAVCARLPPVTGTAMAMQHLSGFVALAPVGEATALAGLAAQVVTALDAFRAPPSAAEIARREPDRLTARQRDHLSIWGYPYVMQDFQFHLTLTGALPLAEAAAVCAVLEPLIKPLMPRPFDIGSLCLFGEAADGRFHLLHRYPLTG